MDLWFQEKTNFLWAKAGSRLFQMFSSYETRLPRVMEKNNTQQIAYFSNSVKYQEMGQYKIRSCSRACNINLNSKKEDQEWSIGVQLGHSHNDSYLFTVMYIFISCQTKIHQKMSNAKLRFFIFIFKKKSFYKNHNPFILERKTSPVVAIRLLLRVYIK